MLRNRILTGVLALSLGGLTIAASAPFLRQAPQATREHGMLMKAVGQWEGELTMWGMGPEPMVAKCTETVEALGEMWTTSKFESDFGGTPFQGVSSTGFDPEKGKFTGTWIDSMTPTMTMMEGVWDKDKGGLVMTYEGPHPMTGETVPHRMESTHSEGSTTSMFYMIVDGKEQRSMKIEMKRVEAAVPAEAGAGR